MLAKDDLFITKLQLELLHQIKDNCYIEDESLVLQSSDISIILRELKKTTFESLPNQILLSNTIAYARSVEIQRLGSETRLICLFKLLGMMDPSSSESLTQTIQELIQLKKTKPIREFFEPVVIRNIMGKLTLNHELKSRLNEEVKEHSFNAETILNYCAEIMNRCDWISAVYWACKFRHDDILLSLLQFLDFDKYTYCTLLNFACEFNNKLAIDALLKKSCETFNWTIEEGLVDYLCQSDNHLHVLKYLSSQDLLSTTAFKKGLCIANQSGVYKILELLATNDMKLLELSSSFFIDLMQDRLSKLSPPNQLIQRMLVNRRHDEQYFPFLSNRNSFFPVVEDYPIPLEIYVLIAAFYHALRPFTFPLSSEDSAYEAQQVVFELNSADYEDSTEEEQDNAPGM